MKRPTTQSNRHAIAAIQKKTVCPFCNKQTDLGLIFIAKGALNHAKTTKHLGLRLE